MALPTPALCHSLLLTLLLLAASAAGAQEPSAAPAAADASALAPALEDSVAAPTTADGSASADSAATPASEPSPAPAPEQLADPNPAPPDYLKLVERALSEYNQGHYAEARGLLAQAHARYPNARTLRGLGMVEFELRHYALSAGYLDQALASKARPLEGALRSETEALLARAYGFVGRVTLKVQPAGLQKPQLTVNGIPTALPADGTLLLDVGDHFLSLKAPSYAEAKRAVSVFGGELSTLRVDLTPAADEARRVPLYKKWWLWTAVGVVAAGAATGLTVRLMKNRDEEPPIRGNYPPGEVVQVLLAK